MIVFFRLGRKVFIYVLYDYVFENIFGDFKKRKENYFVILIYCVGINWVGYGYEVCVEIFLFGLGRIIKDILFFNGDVLMICGFFILRNFVMLFILLIDIVVDKVKNLVFGFIVCNCLMLWKMG